MTNFNLTGQNIIPNNSFYNFIPQIQPPINDINDSDSNAHDPNNENEKDLSTENIVEVFEAKTLRDNFVEEDEPFRVLSKEHKKIIVIKIIAC